MSQVILNSGSTQAWVGNAQGNPKCFLLTQGDPCNVGSTFTRDDNGQAYVPDYIVSCHTMSQTNTVDVDFTKTIHDENGNTYSSLIGGHPPKNP